jgi:hypothetical protein
MYVNRAQPRGGIKRLSSSETDVTTKPSAVSVACLLALAAPLFAQGRSEPDVPEKAGKELHAFRITASPPKIDGRLDD